MIYLSWAGVYEGPSDGAYYETLLPRLMGSILRSERKQDVTVPETPAMRFRSGRERDAVAKEVCDNSEAFHLLFIHVDTGGRGLEESTALQSSDYSRAVQERCSWHQDRCLPIQPRHEMEAWALADPAAVLAAFGVTGEAARYGLPATALEAERLVDPKAALDNAERQIRGRRARQSRTDLLVSIAQRQSMDTLRGARSFQTLEAHLRRGLASLGCL